MMYVTSPDGSEKYIADYVCIYTETENRQTPKPVVGKVNKGEVGKGYMCIVLRPVLTLAFFLYV